ncbi:MAG: hypothetical protein IJZ35_09715 [Clostridia bacterium]|nr:hypothetical protein [Clostridia bacterium]
MEDIKLIKRKMSDLASDSYNRNLWEYSKFLNLAEQSEMQTEKYPVKYYFFGGYDNAERNIAVFGNINDIGYEPSYPISFVEISPVNQRFADTLTHRDFLGALMSLGINREMLGDILVNDKSAVVICIDSIAAYIINELECIKHTTVRCRTVDRVPDNILPEFDNTEHIVSSERIDVLISAVYNLSRNSSQSLINSEKVFCDGRAVSSTSFIPKVGQIISVRGMGRFIFDGVLRTTKKNKLVISVKKYKS